jgi:hypothetical protein
VGDEEHVRRVEEAALSLDQQLTQMSIPGISDFPVRLFGVGVSNFSLSTVRSVARLMGRALEAGPVPMKMQTRAHNQSTFPRAKWHRCFGA